MATIVAGNPKRPQQVRTERKDGFTARKRTLFLSRLAATCNVRLSSAAAGITAKTAYGFRRRNAAFAAAWDEALNVGYLRLEEALLLHAMTCLDVGEMDQGEMDRVEMDRVEMAGDEHDGQAAGAPDAAPPGSAPLRRLGTAEVQAVLKLMDRHRATVEGRRPVARSSRRYTAEETDAALTRQLDALAIKLRRGA